MVDKAMSVKASLDEEGFIYQEHMLSRLGLMAARDRGNLTEALQYKQQLYASLLALSNTSNSCMLLV